MPKVSVIIPVYNTEMYLKRCLNSLTNQTLRDIEFICVDDCSADNSLQILKDFRNNDDRIKIIKLEENKGVATARNIGIKESQGEYIGFVDSDDYVDLDFYEKLYQYAANKSADVVKGNVYTVDDSGKTFIEDFYKMNDRIKDDCTYFLYGFTSAIYKSSFIKKNDIKFPENIKYFEDPYFSIDVTLHTNNILTVDDAKYFYARRQDSAVGKCKTLEKTIDFACSAKLILKKINSYDINEGQYKIYFNFLLEQLLPWCWAFCLKDEANVVATQAIYDLGNMAKFEIVDLLAYHFLKKKTEERNKLIKSLRSHIAHAK